MDQNFTTVLVTVPTYYGSMLNEAIDKFYRTVVAQAESLRKRPDGGTASLRQSFYGQKELVLLRFDALRPELLLRSDAGIDGCESGTRQAAGIPQPKSLCGAALG